MAVQKGKVLTGVRARFMLDGVIVGYATGVDVSEAITYEPVKVLDSIRVAEHVPTDYDVELSASFIRIIGASLKAQGFFPKQGVTAQNFLSNILTSGVMTAVLEDTHTGTIVSVVEEVRIARKQVNISARGIVGKNVTFVAVAVRDEADATP